MLFLNPAYLAALLLGALPIIIHLIRKRRVRIVQWAAWDFLMTSKKKNRRKLRLEQLLLLILRVMIVLMVVFAFARPLFQSLGLPMVNSDARIHAVIAIDNSYSMGHQTGGVPNFEQARRLAEELLNRTLKQGDSVSVVLLSSRPEALLKEPTFDFGKAKERIRSARVSDYGTDYGNGAAFLTGLLKEVKAPVKEVYLLTDNQKAGFLEGAGERTQAAWKQLGALARINWINVAAQNRENISIDSPTFSRELVTPQSPVRIDTLVHNYGNTPKTGLLVNLNVDGRAAGSAKVDVPANGKASAQFVYLFEKAGAHVGSLKLGQPDALDRDNTVYFASRVREKLKVLIVNPRPNQDPAKDEAFYIATALAPTGNTQGTNATIFPTIHNGPRLTGLNLLSYDAVVVTGLTDIAPTDRKALEEFARLGGGVLLFPGGTTDPNLVNVNLGAGADDSLSPAKLGLRSSLNDDNAITMNPASVSHPALATFRDTSEVNLGSARFTMIYDIRTQPSDEKVRSLVRFSNGSPAMVERSFGEGKVILAGFSAGVAGSNFPFKPAFVPMVHQVVAYLAAGPSSQHNVRIGDPISARFDVKDANKPIRLTDPNSAVTIQKSTLTGDGALFRYPNTRSIGHYKIGFAENEVVDAFAVNLPAGESDLTTIEEQAIRAAIGPVAVQFSNGSENLESVVKRSRRGTEIWRLLILAAVPLLFLEALLAQRFGRRG